MFIFVTFIVSLAALAAGFVQSGWSGRTWDLPFYRVAVIGAGICVLALGLSLAQYFFVEGRLEYLLGTFGISSLIAKALALGVCALLSYVLGLCLSFKGAKRQVGVIALSGLAAAYYGLLWLGTKDDIATVDGELLKCAAIDARGVRYFEKKQLDPRTAAPCVWVTEENVDYFRRIDEKLRAGKGAERVTRGPFFGLGPRGSTVALVWFSRAADGSIELWDAPLPHPERGVPLKPITQEIADEWARQQGQAVQPPSAAGPSQAAPVAAAAVPAPRQEDTSALRRRYLTASALEGPEAGQRPRWTIVAWGRNELRPVIEEGIVELARQAGLPPPRRVFGDALVTSGSAESVMGGDVSLLSRLRLEELVDYVVLARGTESALPPDKYGNISSVRTGLEVRVLRTGREAGSRALRADDVGAGRDEQAAAERAYQKSLERIAPALSAELKEIAK